MVTKENTPSIRVEIHTQSSAPQRITEQDSYIVSLTLKAISRFGKNPKWKTYVSSNPEALPVITISPLLVFTPYPENMRSIVYHLGEVLYDSGKVKRLGSYRFKAPKVPKKEITPSKLGVLSKLTLSLPRDSYINWVIYLILNKAEIIHY